MTFSPVMRTNAGQRAGARPGTHKHAGPLVALIWVILLTALPHYGRADEAFRAFLDGLWPEAQSLGIKRQVFDAALSGLEPDLSLPDLALAGRQASEAKQQAEFSQTAQDYIRRSYIVSLAEKGKALAAKHQGILKRIEAEIGVDGPAVLAIWARETAYGNYQLPHDAIRVLATQAYLGRRKELFRNELLAAIKMLQMGVPRSDMRSSWAGAVGLTQFMPSEYFVHGYDLDRDGRIDVAHSVGDALASAARQLQGKGWILGQPWGYEVRVPPAADCALEGPSQARPLSAWVKLGFARAGSRPFPDQLLASEAYLMMPAGAYGPAFLVFENYRVIRRYNTSDLYAVFVGHLMDRIAGGADFVVPWAATGPPKARVVEEIQKRLTSAGYAMEKVDGKIGSITRRQIGAYQKANKLKVDCWPTDAVLAHLRSVAAR